MRKFAVGRQAETYEGLHDFVLVNLAVPVVVPGNEQVSSELHVFSYSHFAGVLRFVVFSGVHPLARRPLIEHLADVVSVGALVLAADI